jgi:F0F1-type ATP synthase assembly protein I
MDKRMLQATSRYSYLGIFFGVAICLGIFGGRWLDRRWNTGPYLEIGGLLVGVAAGFRELYRLSKQALEDQK